MSNQKWLFIGTDERLNVCKNLMSGDGYDCRIVQTDHYSEELSNEIIHFQPNHIVFPILQMTGTIPVELLKNKPTLYTGVTSTEWLKSFQEAGLSIHSYLKEELYIWENAHITAEAFLKEFYMETDRTIRDSLFLIAGFGRVGKMVAEMLRGVGGRVMVVARAEAQLAEAKMLGYQIASIAEDLPLEGAYLVNTIPAKWLKIGNQQPRFIFDLASAPGCLAETENVEYYTLLPGLPGKHFPFDAANALRDALKRINRR
ncbi:NAD-binding protein [Sporosarcina ureilytica]|uniref:S-adenosyl-L-homocysteine hydrolase NAD binding domain-containing protein n=1 Tax=Sporosarcina ureilytica TaxID=298596 RepID=A0A1D8JHS1_9BACL|nr:NAD-binding protein [Sporosarcina ureilytica]AOV08224.1 hypothetical protein BI350_12235 [Sporosarcina ureilytica]